MAQMRYYRRPQLAGKSIRLSSVAAIRGNLRRHAPDSLSQYPYFRGFSPGLTLIITTQSGTVTPFFDNGRVDHILERLNDPTNGLPSIDAEAFDDGGCIGIRCRISGSAGWVQIDGGTAAELLGFDLQAQTYRSVGGDMNSTHEGMVGQPFGTVLPDPGENLSSEVFVRSIGRVMANTDVLFAELMRADAVMQHIGSYDAPGNVNFVTLPTAQKVFVGMPAGRSKEELARFFLLIDKVTGQPSQSRVTDVTNTSNVTLLGKDQVVAGPTTITAVKNGRVLQATGAAFTDWCQVGDYAEIAGAVSTAPWSNNGYRYVIEEIIDENTVALRPMSPVELAAVETVLGDEQPIVELNRSEPGDSQLGTITVKRGPFAARARLQVSPPLPAGASVDIYAAVPISKRDRQFAALQDTGYGVYASLTGNHDTSPNALLTRPTVQTTSSTTISVSPFMVRWHGHPVRVPGQSFSTSGHNGDVFVYWDENDCLVKMSASYADIFNVEQRAGITGDELNGLTPDTANKGKTLATVVVSNSSITGIVPSAKVEASDTLSITVGFGGQFTKLEEALKYLSQWFNSGNSFSAAELIITSDLSTSASYSVPAPGVSIRGAYPTVKITGPVGAPIFDVGTRSLFLSDVTVELGSGGAIYSGTSTDIWLSRVQVVGESWRRTIGGPGTVDIGADSSAVYVGRASHTTYIRGPVEADEGVHMPSDHILQVGARGGLGSSLDTDGTQGRLVLGKTGESDVALTKDQVDILRGGTDSDAQSLHKHQDLINKVDDLQPDAAPPTISSNQIGTGTKLARQNHNHAHGDQGNGSLHTVATQSVQGFMSAADKLKLDGIETNANNYSLPAASAASRGGIKVGAGLAIDGDVLRATNVAVGSVTNVTGTAPIEVLNGTSTPAISIAAATQAAAGSMSAADKTKLDNLNLAAVMEPGRIYKCLDSYVSTESTAWSRFWDIETGPIKTGFSVAQGVANPSSYKLVVHFVFNGFTHSSQDGDIFTRVAVVNNPFTGDPFSATGFNRLAYVSGTFANPTGLAWAGLEFNWNVPDRSAHWICHCRYVFDIQDTPNGVHIAIDARSNGTTVISQDEFGDEPTLIWVKPAMPWVASHVGHQCFVYVM